jgi:hypothetical protein
VEDRPVLVDRGPFGNPTSDSARDHSGDPATTSVLVAVYAPRRRGGAAHGVLDVTAARPARFSGGRERAADLAT